MEVDIPGSGKITINQILLDYNGTLAIDGELIPGVAAAIQVLAEQIPIYVITADTYGSVQSALNNTQCRIVTIQETKQDEQKLEHLRALGKKSTMAVGNGRNDRLMLREAVLGIALIQGEGACVESVLAADIVCTDILDVFGYFQTPDRLKATLRN